MTPRPFVQGPQTAIVDGPAGEEIHTDKYGRVKVQFHWDRLGQKDENTSCWIRVSQGWAGQELGPDPHPAHRPGGDRRLPRRRPGPADRHRARLQRREHVPYALPANKTQSGIKIRFARTGGGGLQRAPLRGQEGRRSRSTSTPRRTSTRVVENNETRKVGGKGIGNRTTTSRTTRRHTIGGNKNTDVTGNFDETIIGKETRTVTGDVTETYHGQRDAHHQRVVTRDRDAAASRAPSVGAVTDTIGGTMTMTVVGAITVTTPSPITRDQRRHRSTTSRPTCCRPRRTSSTPVRPTATPMASCRATAASRSRTSAW